MVNKYQQIVATYCFTTKMYFNILDTLMHIHSCNGKNTLGASEIKIFFCKIYKSKIRMDCNRK